MFRSFLRSLCLSWFEPLNRCGLGAHCQADDVMAMIANGKRPTRCGTDWDRACICLQDHCRQEGVLNGRGRQTACWLESGSDAHCI